MTVKGKYIDEYNDLKIIFDKISNNNIDEYLSMKSSSLEKMYDDEEIKLRELNNEKKRLRRENRNTLINKCGEGDVYYNVLSNDYFFLGRQNLKYKSSLSTYKSNKDAINTFPTNTEKKEIYEIGDIVYFRLNNSVKKGEIVRMNKNETYVIKYADYDKIRNCYKMNIEYSVIKFNIRLLIQDESNKYKINDKIVVKEGNNEIEYKIIQINNNELILLKNNGIVIKHIE